MEPKPIFTYPPGFLLPNVDPLPGAVVAQYRTRNGKTYGPYWFRFWREGGKLRKEYVPRDRLEAVRDACQVHKERSKSPKERAREWATWRRKEERATKAFLFMLECKARMDQGRPLHYLQDRKARRILGLEAE